MRDMDKINTNIREHRSITGPGIDEIELMELHEFDMFEALEASDRMTDVEDGRDPDLELGGEGFIDSFAAAFDGESLLAGEDDPLTQPLGAVAEGELPDLDLEGDL